MNCHMFTPLQIKEQQQPTQSFKELELKEMSTRQKLLARREQMRNFGFSTPTLFRQTAPSTSSFLSSGHLTLSRTSSVTLHWEDGARENGDQCRTVPSSSTLSIPASNNRNFVAKPVVTRSGSQGSSRKIHNMTPSSQSSSSKRGFSSQERFSNKVGMTGKGKQSCPIVDYMKNSHQTMYHKSTFPRRIENGVCSDMRGTKSEQRTTSKRQRASANSESILARSSSSSCLQSKEQSSGSIKAEFVSTVPPEAVNTDDKSVTANDATQNQAEITKREADKCSEFKTSPGETAASKSRENMKGQSPPFVICLNREHRVRVLRIREFVSAAEVIQRRWRLYKRIKNGEGTK